MKHTYKIKMLETEKGGQAEIDPVIYSISEH